MENKILALFQKTGSALCREGLVYATHGNFSVRRGDSLIIKRSGANLGFLEKPELIETGIYRDDPRTPLASSELPVHREIYKQTPTLAVVHAHPPYAIALSLLGKEIVPRDAEGKAMAGSIPVVGFGMEFHPGAWSDEVAEVLQKVCIVMVCGHGSFATGQTLDEAYRYTVILEKSARLICQQREIKPAVGKE